MKKTFIRFGAFVIVAAVCIGLTGCININLNGYPRVMGNGQVVTKEISLPQNLAGVRTLTSIDILLDPALKDKAVLEGESNILDLTEVQTTGDVLTIDYKPHFIIVGTRPVKLRVPEIGGGLLETSSSGSISMLGSDTLKGDSFELRSSSSGSITVAIEAKELKAVASSSGSIRVTGSAATGDIVLSSSGSFDGFDCRMQSADARLSSSGDAQVYVSGELTGSTSSSGSIIYDGNPGNVNVSSSSSGKAVSR